MKYAMKLASIVLALVMVLSLTTTAFATQEGTIDGGSITINNAVSGETYNIYQILYLESYHVDNEEDGAGQYAYKANSAWAKWLEENAKAYVSIDGQGYVTWVEGANVADFAAAAKGFAKTLSADDTAKAEGTTVTFSNLKLGYYLLDSSLGTLCSLDTTNPNAIIQEKNEKPTIDKTVQEDSTGNYGDTNDADIGQTVNFKTTVHAKKGARNYVVHDKMSAGLTFGSVTSVKVGDNVLASPADYSVVTAGIDDGCTFHVVFTESYLNSIAADTDIVIEYTATLNENAVIAGEGNPNDTKLTYGDSSETEWDHTITYTWKMPIFKYTKDGETEKPLAGAEFVLYKTVDGTNQYAKVTNGKLTGWTESKTEATTLVSGADGKIEVEGLDADTYYIEETKAPDGYNKLADPIEVKIGENGAMTMGESPVTQVGVENQSGTELPSTGGMGTTVIYVAGGALVLLAMIVLVMKKRMKAAK